MCELDGNKIKDKRKEIQASGENGSEDPNWHKVKFDLYEDSDENIMEYNGKKVDDMFKAENKTASPIKVIFYYNFVGCLTNVAYYLLEQWLNHEWIFAYDAIPTWSQASASTIVKSLSRAQIHRYWFYTGMHIIFTISSFLVAWRIQIFLWLVMFIKMSTTKHKADLPTAPKFNSIHSKRLFSICREAILRQNQEDVKGIDVLMYSLQLLDWS